MTKPWKLKKNSSNILLVLLTLILIKAKCIKGEYDDLSEKSKEDKIHNSIEEDDSQNDVQMYVGNDDIAQFFFQTSSKNTSLILEDINKCLDSFQLVTCLKMLLLDRINNVMTFLKDPSVTNADLHFLKGLLVFKRKNESENTISSENSENLSLDKEITIKVLKMFQDRSLQINLFPRIKMEIEPVAGQKVEDFVCFKYKFYREEKFLENEGEKLEQGRKKRKGGGMSMMMMLPQLLMLGFMPFTLASLKAMVMNAVMINMMALNGAIFMTIRNLVFGPRKGDNVKYVNYGYSKDRQTQSRKPVLIIHSPAAFVKQPKVHKKPIRRPPPSSEIFIWDPETKKGHFVKNSGTHYDHSFDSFHNSHNSGHHFEHSDDSYQSHQDSEHHLDHSGIGFDLPQNSEYFDHSGGNFHIVPENEVGSHGLGLDHDHNRRKQTIQRRNDDSSSNKNPFLVRDVNGKNSHQRNPNKNQSQIFSSNSRKPWPSSREGFQSKENPGKLKKDTEFRPSPQWDPMEQPFPTEIDKNLTGAIHRQ